MPSSATLQTPSSPQIHNLPLDYFYSATLAPFYSALDSQDCRGCTSLSWNHKQGQSTVDDCDSGTFAGVAQRRGSDRSGLEMEQEVTGGTTGGIVAIPE